MSRKTLLTEAEVRQFLKLANLGSIGDARIQEMGGYGMPGGRDEEEERRGSSAGNCHKNGVARSTKRLGRRRRRRRRR